MGLLGIEGGGRWAIFGFALRCVLLYLMVGLAASNVVLIGKNVSLSFNDIEASFTPDIKGSGECGVLHIAEPLDACTSLKNKLVEGSKSPFVLIRRGGCTFDDKVRAAQRARFKAAIVYNYEESDALVAMAGTSVGISIHAVFVSKSSGEVLRKYAGRTDVELWIIPTFENSAWSIMAISFISLLAMAAVLATCFFVRRHRIRRERPRAPNIREFHGMSSRLVKAMPSLIFTSVLEDNCTSRTCAICLEDYNVGEQLRILPCRHKFHAICVDNWLTSWRTFCPVCKQDARTSTSNPPPSESTPLLSSGPPTPSSSIAILSSFHSSPPSSSIPIMPTPPLPSRTHSLSGAPPRVPHPRGPYANSPPISVSRSSVDLWNASSNRSHLASPHSIGAHLSSSSPPMNSRYLSSPMNSRFISAYIPSPAYASPSYHSGSSGRQSYLRHCNDSGTSLSALASAQSLPGC